MDIETYFDEIGEAVQRDRHRADMTQKQLAEVADVSYDTVKSVENGRHHASIDILFALSEALGVDLPEILTEAFYAARFKQGT